MNCRIAWRTALAAAVFGWGATADASQRARCTFEAKVVSVTQVFTLGGQSRSPGPDQKSPASQKRWISALPDGSDREQIPVKTTGYLEDGYVMMVAPIWKKAEPDPRGSSSCGELERRSKPDGVLAFNVTRASVETLRGAERVKIRYQSASGMTRRGLSSSTTWKVEELVPKTSKRKE